MPIGIADVSGILTIHFIDADIPLLLPVGMFDSLGMVLDVFSFRCCGVSPLEIYGVTMAAAMDLWGYGVGCVYLRGCGV